MKNLLICLGVLLISHNCFAQETVERSRKLTPEVTEKYHVLKSDYEVKQGMYSAYLKKVLVAAGNYTKNKKTGTWTFFDSKGKVSQRFNYDKLTLIYEAPQDTTSHIRYVVDDSLKNNPVFSRPVRIGGNYFGYLPYINVIKLPQNLANLSNETDLVLMELLITPLGRLAGYKLRITPMWATRQYEDVVLNINLNLLADEDKVFVPATLNNEPTAVRIVVPCSFFKSDLIRL
ncbi:hypothetical protein MUGA111182_12365 [Mucilaginibacter galii]|uniref:hypothetical protein n=1 Tax=Mucilaginibacter galii TaxID=2005073 RepID=UPI0016658673|nr:hypothetical protein [Mucilaginibacter galii]